MDAAPPQRYISEVYYITPISYYNSTPQRRENKFRAVIFSSNQQKKFSYFSLGVIFVFVHYRWELKIYEQAHCRVYTYMYMYLSSVVSSKSPSMELVHSPTSLSHSTAASGLTGIRACKLRNSARNSCEGRWSNGRCVCETVSFSSNDEENLSKFCRKLETATSVHSPHCFCE